MRNGSGSKMRRGFFLATAARYGLHGGLLKDDEGHIEVGPGFADAAARQSGDDNRTEEDKARAQIPASESDIVDGSADDQPSGDSGDDDDTGDSGDSDEDGEGKEPPKKKRDTGQYIRDLKKEARELRQRVAALEKSPLQPKNPGGNEEITSGKPDPSDGSKYPLGVLDDGYIEDLSEWKAEQAVSRRLNEERQRQEAQAEQQRVEKHAATLRSKVDELSAKGSEIFDDYEETVLEAGLRGDYRLTETTFTAAAESEYGSEILYALANDPAEAKRVSEMTVVQQVRYVDQKNSEIAAKKTARRKPQAGDPPSNLPRGRNSSNPIRPDTDNLDDFRKIYYQ